jgi:hypothetical protein
MKFILLVFGFTTISASAQFDVVQYFSDPVSFSFEACSSGPLKKGQAHYCNTINSVVRIIGEQFKITESSVKTQSGKESSINADQLDYVEGNISSIDFYRSTINKHKENSSTNTTTPAEVYELRLMAKNEGPWFADQSRYFGRKGVYSTYLYFPSYKAAQEAKDFLESLNEINTRANAGGVLQELPGSKCDAKGSRYVNKDYGYTLCLMTEETAAELTYSKYNYQYLKDFTTIKGYSDLPFYVCPIKFNLEKDSLAVFKKFEAEFFNRLGDAVTKKEIYLDNHTKASAITAHGSYFRGYNVTLKGGGEAHICFEYMTEGNTKFDALCFAYMSPGGLSGAGYSFRNSALLLESVVLTFK